MLITSISLVFYGRKCELHYSNVPDWFTRVRWEHDYCEKRLTTVLSRQIKEGYTCYCGAAASHAGIVRITEDGYVCSEESS